MIIHCISDLHGFFPKLEGGDLLIIAGDCTSNDSLKEWGRFFDWLEPLNYKKKIIVAGNHDNWCKQWATAGTFSDEAWEKMYPKEKPTFDYLCDSGTEFHGMENDGKSRTMKIWGSPWSLSFGGMNPRCKAFTGGEPELFEKFEMIPEDVDILITHTPPFGILDSCKPRYPDFEHKNFGSRSLRHFLYTEKIRPKLHVFGHIHESHGEVSNMMDYPGVHFVNAAIMDEGYNAVNKPIEVVL